MREVPVRVAFGSDTLIDLEYVHACPRNVFVGKSTKHHPWGVASADSHDETTADGNGLAGFGGNYGGSFSGDCVRVGKHFNSHWSTPYFGKRPYLTDVMPETIGLSHGLHGL